ncbi:MAG: hypothetical protein DRI34_02425 [Deltaproteobacteria bacterium]|nr:MAG: hypothetical protein DRI34_02425 [Deltaproteobacteria bacterium]
MTTILAIVAAVVLAFLGAQLYRWRQAPAWLEDIIFSGLPFFLVGWLFGPRRFGLIDDTDLAGLGVVVNLAIGWVGFLFGLQFDRHTVRRLPPRHLLATTTEAAVTLGVVVACMWVFIRAGDPCLPAGWLALLLGVVALPSAPALVALALRRGGDNEDRKRALLTMASLDGLPAVVLLALLLCFAPGPALLGPGTMLALILGLGLASGVLLQLLTLPRTTDNELVIILLGLVLFAGGAASLLALSPLLVNLLAGLVVALRSPNLNRIRGAMIRLEKPVFLIMMTLAGAMWSLPLAAIGLVPLFVLVRLAGKLAAGALAGRLLVPAAPASLGGGLVPHGALAMALALSVQGQVPRAAAGLVLSAVVAGMLASAALGRATSRWALDEEMGR